MCFLPPSWLYCALCCWVEESKRKGIEPDMEISWAPCKSSTAYLYLHRAQVHENTHTPPLPDLSDCSGAKTFIATGDDEARSPPLKYSFWSGRRLLLCIQLRKEDLQTWLSLLQLSDRGSWTGGIENYGSIDLVLLFLHCYTS